LKNGKTIVHTTYGHSLTIIMKPKALQDKRNQASFLHITFLERYQMNKTMSVAFEKNSGISLVMEDGNLNYTVEENKRKSG
jgi:hypothetical protein